jgi:hypothetical protein
MIENFKTREEYFKHLDEMKTREFIEVLQDALTEDATDFLAYFMKATKGRYSPEEITEFLDEQGIPSFFRNREFRTRPFLPTLEDVTVFKTKTEK